jgi:hypothetical protein
MMYFDRFLINIIKNLKGSKFNAGERSWYTLLENKAEFIEQLIQFKYEYNETIHNKVRFSMNNLLVLKFIKNINT